MENTALNPPASMLLSMQMIADPMDELFWEFGLYTKGDRPCLRSCLLYCGQTSLSPDILYLIPEGKGGHFPTDQFCYISPEEIPGQAPHIQGLNHPIAEIMNQVITTFQKYHDFEMRLNHALTDGGTLKDLCRIGSEFFHNPMYIHNNMFAVIAYSSRVEGMLKFEYNKKTGKLHIPLWLIDDFKFDSAYQETLTLHHAGIWNNEQYPYTIRSLFVNLWNGKNYYGRLLINELGTPLLPGQYQAAEYLAGYMVRMLQNEHILNRDYRDFEDTFIDLMNHDNVDGQDLRAMLTILDWKEEDRYLCIKLQSQRGGSLIRSDSALDSTLAAVLSGYSSFYHQEQLCIVINLSLSGTDPDSIRLLLAPHIRDSYMYGGISNPIAGIQNLYAGFMQVDIVLDYILKKDNSIWLIPFSACALSYMMECAIQKMPPEHLASSAISDLLRFDRENDTQYFETLKAYLLNERNIPQTAEALIIHRTTLTYRLKKISQLTRLNMDDDRQRMYALLSFYLLEESKK